MKRIYIRAVGIGAEGLCDFLVLSLPPVFGLDAAPLAPVDIPPNAYNRERRQYFSSALFAPLEQDLPPDALRVLGVAAVDLFVPQLSFVFGEAKLGGPSAVISISRLRAEFYGQERNETLLVKRVQTEAVHELGHTFGLRHCPKPSCVMHFSNNIVQTDEKGPGFCEVCARRLAEAFKERAAGFTRSGGSLE